MLQIIQQRGHFRHVTEKSLLAEDGDEDEDEGVRVLQQDEEEETPEKRDEKLIKIRENMFRQLERAQNDTLVALEMVSFLLSKHSIPAQSTMSDELKKRVPTGTLDSKVVQAREVSEAKAKQFIRNSQGWRSTNFNSTSQNLASASVRMRSEAERESKYWEEMATLRESGIAISRYPRESHAVAVHFGSANSIPPFQQRGMAVIRQDADSRVYIDQGSAATRGDRMQVEIFRGTRKTGCHAFSSTALNNATNGTQAILEARDSLTIDELFHEISREARITANQGITTRGQTISFDVEEEYEVALTVKNGSWESNQALTENSLAEYICLSLRSLLSEAHRQNYIRRTHTPPAMVAKLTQIPEYAILRPLVASLRHRALVSELRAKINESLVEPVRQAGLDTDWQDSSSATGKPEKGIDVDLTISPDESCRSSFTYVLPTRERVRIVVTSHLGSPIYGTQYDVSGPSHGFAPIKRNVYHDLKTAVGGLTDLLMLDLVALITSITIDSSNATNLPSSGWEVSRPHNGELTLRSQKSRKSVAGMRVDVIDAKLILRVSPAKPEYQKGKKILAWMWSHRTASNQHSVTGNSEDINVEQNVAETLTFSEVVERSLALAR